MTVHQLLFGYDQGHDLLAGSVELPPHARRRALVLSDLSGPEPLPAFDGYLTGYSLPSLGAFALARTWNAPEMPRPGCVWTHTLLVSFADLASVPSLGTLLPAFSRPEGHALDLASYAEPLSVSPGKADRRSPPFDRALARSVLRALYVDVDRTPPPVAVVAPRPGEVEALVLAVWAQQWPRLRRSFSFCTGALELRAVDDSPLDIQITPQARPSLGTTQPRVLTLADTVTPSSGEQDPDWLDAALDDLASVEGTDFRRRLRTYGADVPGERWAFAALADVLSRERGGIEDTVSVLAARFPHPEEGGTLKAEWLQRRSRAPVHSEHDALAVLLTTPHYEAFDPRALEVSARVEALWKKERGEALGILRTLLEGAPNPWGVEALQDLLDSASAAELFRALADSDLGVLALFDRRPELLRDPKLWSGSRLLLDRAMGALREQPDTDWSRVARAMLDSGVDTYAAEIEGNLGRHAARLALEWLLADGGRALPRGWLAVVAQHVDALAALAEERPERPLGSLLVDLGPDRALRAVPPVAWMPLRSEMGRDRLTFDALLLSLGLFDAGGDGLPVVEALFQTVHDKVRTLPRPARRWLSVHAPSLGWRVWESVSPEEELRRSLVRRALGYRWDADALRRAVRKKKTRSSFANTLRKTSGARSLYRAFVGEDESEEGERSAPRVK